ncbi:MAG: CPBP family intramembrane metalloprotease [Gemmatimonadota bacterium]|nr:CPBP family intramembrane metalloprotease [Gemmatimonadota bacterium]
MLTTLVKRHPVASYILLAYACSWAIALPLALQAQHVIATRIPFALHYVSGLGPAIAALILTQLLGRARPKEGRPDRPDGGGHSTPWLLVGFASPLLLLAVAQLAGRILGQSTPTWTALGQVNFLPDLGLAAWGLWFVANGLGEELGWRGFFLPRLQRSHSALASSLLLSIAWAGWHLPAFFYVPSYVALGLRVLPGFFLGILAGAIVLTWLYNGSRGSVLAVALWHGSFNFVSASPAASGFAAAVTSSLVMVWAVVVVWRYGAASLAAVPKQVMPTGVLATGEA